MALQEAVLEQVGTFLVQQPIRNTEGLLQKHRIPKGSHQGIKTLARSSRNREDDDDNDE